MNKEKRFIKGRFRKGRSGNIFGRPKETEEKKLINRALKKATKDLIRDYTMKLAEALPKIEPVIIQMAIQGDIQAIRELHNRVLGLPKADINISGELPIPLLPIDMIRADAHRIRVTEMMKELPEAKEAKTFEPEEPTKGFLEGSQAMAKLNETDRILDKEKAKEKEKIRKERERSKADYQHEKQPKPKWETLPDPNPEALKEFEEKKSNKRNPVEKNTRDNPDTYYWPSSFNTKRDKSRDSSR